MKKAKFINGDTIFGVVIGVIAICFIVASTKFPTGTHDGVPGPGYFPTLAAAMVLLFAVLLIIQGIRKPQKHFDMSETPKSNLIQMLMVIADVGLFLALWNFLSFVVAAAVLVFIMCMIFKQKLLFSAIYTVVLVGALYLIFSVAFRVSLDII